MKATSLKKLLIINGKMVKIKVFNITNFEYFITIYGRLKLLFN